MFKHCLIVFLVSMVPIIELRGAIPYGVGFGLPLWLTYIIAIVGNMLPVPLTGFGYCLAKGVAKAVAEKGLLGALTGGLTATAGGIAAAVVFGVLAALIFRPGDKR